MGLFSPSKKTLSQQKSISSIDLNKMGKVQHSPKKEKILLATPNTNCNVNKIREENIASTSNLIIPSYNANNNKIKSASTSSLSNSMISAYVNNIELSASTSSSANNINSANVNNIELSASTSTSANNIRSNQEVVAEQTLIQTGMDRYITVTSKRKRSPNATQFNNKNKASRLEVNQIPLENRFSSLDVDSDDKKTKNEKPPPIYLREASNNELVTKLKSLTDSKFYIAPLKRGKILETKIQPFEVDGFRAIVDYFDKSEKRFYTYQLKSQKGLSVVIKGIDNCVDVNDIFAALTKEGFHAKSITNILNRNKEPQPMFRVELEPDQSGAKASRDIYNLKYLLHRKISVEEPNKRIGPIQCIKCQEYGHTRSYCTLNEVCVICGELHDSKHCDKSKEDPLVKRCSNCGENHTANYRGCPVYLELKSRTNPKLRAEQRMLKANYNQRSMTSRVSIAKPLNAYSNPQYENLSSTDSFANPGVSYASVLKGSAPKAKVQFNEEESNTHAAINKLTETIQSFMLMMERQMSMMMQNMSTLMQIIVKNQK